MARMWGGNAAQDEPETATQAASTPSVSMNPIERAIMGALASNPQVKEAVQGLMQLAQQFVAQQNAMAVILQRQQAQIEQLLSLQAGRIEQHGGSKITIEGVIADGSKCPTCGSTEACGCFTSEGGDNGEA